MSLQHVIVSSHRSNTDFAIDETTEDHICSPHSLANEKTAVGIPRPAYHRPDSHDQTSPLCTHCGGLSPRSGSTTVYGTPLKRSPNASVVSINSSLVSSLEKLKEAQKDGGVCLVERLHKQDDINHMPRWKQRMNHFTPLTSMVALATYWVYFVFRIRYTINAQNVAHKTYAMAWVFIVVEMGMAFPSLLHQTWLLFLLKGRNREKLRIVGDVTPSVDVFITCCGEEIGLILDTVMAAAEVDWPRDRFRVVVLDDGADEVLRRRVEALASEVYPNLFYTARAKVEGVDHHFKAGNLNHGLEFVSGLPGGASDHVAALDADMIPEPNWLRAIIAHLVIDSQLALSCPPQLFYNVPNNDPLMQSLDSFVHIFEPVKDSAGVAWCTGSGYAIRRKAIDSIGGFPTGSLAEDVCCSSVLLGAGWKTAYVHEPLQYGTVPDSFIGHIKQRTRWTIGTIQTTIKLNFCLFGPLVKQMTVFQRLSGLVYTISSMFSIIHTMSLMTMPIVLISGGRMVAYANNNELRWLIRLTWFLLIANRINEWCMYLPAGYRLGQRDSGAMVWMAPYHALIVIRSFILPKWLGGKVMAFKPSGGMKSELNERDAHLRAPLIRRMKVIFWDCKVIMHVLYLLFCIAAIVKSTALGIIRNKDSSDRVLVFLLTHAFWPPVLWLVAFAAVWAPIKYAIWPPTVPDREDLLVRDPVTGVAHPTEAAKKIVWEKNYAWHEVQYTILTIYGTVLFVGSFYY